MIDDKIKYIYILDYHDATICEIKIEDFDKEKEIENIIEEHGCNINTSSWMTCTSKIDNIIQI